MTKTVTIAQTGDVTEVAFTEGMTLGEALKGAEIEIGEGRSARLNGTVTDDMSATLSANDTILIVGEIRGA